MIYIVDSGNGEPLDISIRRVEKVFKPLSTVTVELTSGKTSFTFNGVIFVCEYTAVPADQFAVTVSNKLFPNLTAGTFLWDGNDYHNQLLYEDKYFDLCIVSSNNGAKLTVSQL